MSAPSERDVQALARRIADAGGEERTRLFRGSWWSDQLLGWAMAKGDFKTQLFRFVDVFPGCRDDDDVMRHLQEYFDGGATPAPLRLGLGIGAKVPFGAGVSAVTARRNIHRMARQFIAGTSAAVALPRLEELWQAGQASTVDLLGEKTLTSDEADRYAQRVGEVLERLAGATAVWAADPLLESDPWGPLPRVNISVKATALAPRFGPLTRQEGLEEARGRLRPLLLRAREVPATIHIDTEHDDIKDLTFELVRALGDEFPSGPALGCVVQAYRKDSYADLRDLVAWSKGALAVPLQIRLVKGAYWDYETVVARAEGWPVPVFEEKRQTDANYERCVRHLIENAGAVRPAFASHNLRSLAYGVAAARAAGLPDGAVEFQMLYGMAGPCPAPCARWGSGYGSTPRSVSWCRAWPTWCAGCWRTRRTSRSSVTASPRARSCGTSSGLRRSRTGTCPTLSRKLRCGPRPTLRSPARSTMSRRPSCGGSRPGPVWWRRWGRPRPAWGSRRRS